MRLVTSCPYVFAVSAVVSIIETPKAILALTIFPVAPHESVIEIGCGSMPVEPSKKSKLEV